MHTTIHRGIQTQKIRTSIFIRPAQTTRHRTSSPLLTPAGAVAYKVRAAPRCRPTGGDAIVAFHVFALGSNPWLACCGSWSKCFSQAPACCVARSQSARRTFAARAGGICPGSKPLALVAPSHLPRMGCALGVYAHRRQWTVRSAHSSTRDRSPTWSSNSSLPAVSRWPGCWESYCTTLWRAGYARSRRQSYRSLCIGNGYGLAGSTKRWRYPGRSSRS